MSLPANSLTKVLLLRGGDGPVPPNLNTFQNKQWHLFPPIDNFSKLKDGKLRRHIRSYFGKPIEIELERENSDEVQRRAVIGTLKPGKYLLGHWGVESRDVDDERPSNVLLDSYDVVRQSMFTPMQVKFKLPPINKRSTDSIYVVWSITLDPSEILPECAKPGSGVVVKVVKEPINNPPEVLYQGSSFAAFSAKTGVVDHSWAKGRAFFRRGRTLGV